MRVQDGTPHRIRLGLTNKQVNRDPQHKVCVNTVQICGGVFHRHRGQIYVIIRVSRFRRGSTFAGREFHGGEGVTGPAGLGDSRPN